jgi:hypothetical protein
MLRRRLSLLALACTIGGCGRPLVCPFHDEFVLHPAQATTASVEGARAVDRAAVIRQRDFGPMEHDADSGTVTHGPLYFEDPFEDNGSEDGQFAWTGEDYLWIFYWRARFLLNGIALPVSALVTPPWTVMASDGVLSRQALGYDHDAERWQGSAELEATSTSENGLDGEIGSTGG